MERVVYEEKSVNKLIFMFGIPSILSLMIEMMTGVVDTIFAGHLPGIGEEALAAMALISPVLGIFTALQTLFAMSTGIVISRYWKNQTRQSAGYMTGMVMTVAVALVTSCICFGILPHLLDALGAQGQVWTLAKQYMEIQLMSNILSSVGYTLTCCVRAFGFPKMEVVIVSLAVFVNMGCNILFAFVWNMGMRGLAWGTLVSEGICMSMAIVYLMKKDCWIKQVPQSKGWFFRSGMELFKIGMAQTAIQVLGGCTGFFLNARLLSVGTMMHVAAWSIVQRIYTMALMPIVGLTQGVQTIISYFNGAGLPEKTRQTSQLTMLYCSGYGVVAMVLLFCLGEEVAAIFGGSAALIGMTKIILMVDFMGFPFVGILYTVMTLLQVTGRELASIVVILSRQVFLLIPLIYLLPWIFQEGNQGITPVMAVFLAMPIADVCAMMLSLIFYRIR